MLTTVITFAGNLADDPQLSFTRGGKAVAEFRVLVNHRTKDAETNEYVDAPTTAYNCKLYGPAAENLAGSIGKGDRVIVHGQTRTETWNDRETNEPRYKDIVLVDEIGASLRWATTTITRTKTTS